jgi:ubiquinone/menaquinone biosynthesis C-methylase UbiE
MANTSVTPWLESYYAKRAHEYDAIYEKPERKAELAWLGERIPELFSGRSVLEVACGTGHWTQYLARTARNVYAFDVNEPVLEIARTKPLPAGKVKFAIGDAFTLDGVPAGFDGAFAGFWWSHVEKRKLKSFLANLHTKLKAGSQVAILDNNYVGWSSTPISRADADGNTYQTRHLANGETYEVLKNFPAAKELKSLLEQCGEVAQAHLESLQFYWLLVYTLK